ncbi:MAG TPA: folylpolyglutamate synthase/dihydrofolate synthase family protein [Chitinophagaceae bacterium]|nr:folylpolyglutamate synthase/dihydrofolate synthase family protein [Chitinophagaceae bacterium]
MNYQQTIDYLFSRLPMYSRMGAAAFKADLVNTLQLCKVLDNPEKKFRTIHVAGTNGKGSVSHMLAAILQTAGYKTGLYTSPHLRDFRERIRINGEMITEQFVIDFTEKMKPVIERVDPSFFELTVVMAFDYFATAKVDIAVIETGLGGRLDSTNVITPELSIITNIGWDHMNLLGNSLEKIAMEKAGIIKPNIPVVIGELLPETRPVFESNASNNHSPISYASQKRQVTDWKWENHFLIVEVAEEHRSDRQVYHLDLPGLYQAKNLLTILEACYVLHEKGWTISNNIIHQALKKVKKLTGLHGRWDIMHTQPLIVADVAHNPDGIKQVVQQAELTLHRELHIVIGVVKDKEVDKILALLPGNAHYYFSKAGIPRALPELELKTKAEQAGLNGEAWPNVNAAINAALAKAHKDDLILVCGSVFLVGEIDLEGLDA